MCEHRQFVAYLYVGYHCDLLHLNLVVYLVEKFVKYSVLIHYFAQLVPQLSVSLNLSYYPLVALLSLQRGHFRHLRIGVKRLGWTMHLR